MTSRVVVLRIDLPYHISANRDLNLGLAYLVDVVPGEWGVRGHEEMAAWCRDQTGDDTDQVVVHIAWIS